MDRSRRYTFRAPTEQDFVEVVAVLLADQRADGVEPTIDAHFLRRFWSRQGFDLAADAWVAVDSAGTLLAYGQVGRGDGGVVGSWGVVHPEQRGRGIGSALLDRIETRATALLAGIPSPRFQHSTNAADQAAGAMLTDRGLRPIRHFWHMQIDLDGPVEPGPAPRASRSTVSSHWRSLARTEAAASDRRSCDERSPRSPTAASCASDRTSTRTT